MDWMINNLPIFGYVSPALKFLALEIPNSQRRTPELHPGRRAPPPPFVRPPHPAPCPLRPPPTPTCSAAQRHGLPACGAPGLHGARCARPTPLRRRTPRPSLALRAAGRACVLCPVLCCSDLPCLGAGRPLYPCTRCRMWRWSKAVACVPLRPQRKKSFKVQGGRGREGSAGGEASRSGHPRQALPRHKMWQHAAPLAL
ncbi:hypothetical protein BS78_08G000900 [Paspalum vaginatum]|nr:hypothetical protein BS78_08G000900 [Paspalum vaginatum]